jgi:hypothetical protein
MPVNTGDNCLTHQCATETGASQPRQNLGAPEAAAMSTMMSKLVKGIRKIIAALRWQRVLIERELYGGRYKHSSKHDDDLPVRWPFSDRP